MASFIQKISEKKLPIISPKGDTLIEVLLAIAIVSLVLAGAYVSSGSSLSVVRNTQEREEALKLAEGHLESLRQVVADGDDSVFDDSPALLFCFDSSNSKVLFSSSSLPGLDADDFSIYPSACKNVSQFYNISIKYDGSSEVFTSTVRWDNRQGEKSQVQLRYRFFIGSVSQIAPPPPAPSPVPVPAPGPGPGP